jgi:hypothetical protein
MTLERPKRGVETKLSFAAVGCGSILQIAALMRESRCKTILGCWIKLNAAPWVGVI